jgi:hypothetical protein
VSVTFKIDSNVKDVTRETEERMNIALRKIAFDWAEDSTRALQDMVYTKENQRVDGVDVRTYRLTRRLGASIAYSAPGLNPQKTFSHDLGTESYTPPPSGRLAAMVGTNVEYAPYVHDGLPGGSVTVKAHQRRTSKGTVQVRSHQRLQAARQAKPFIEQPGINISKQVPDYLLKELNQ